MNHQLPAVKISMIEGSLKCLIFGLLGLLPVIGLPFALAALWISGRVRPDEKLCWNAAKPLRVWGVICAAFGAILWGFLDTLLIYEALNA